MLLAKAKLESCTLWTKPKVGHHLTFANHFVPTLWSPNMNETIAGFVIWSRTERAGTRNGDLYGNSFCTIGTNKSTAWIHWFYWSEMVDWRSGKFPSYSSIVFSAFGSSATFPAFKFITLDFPASCFVLVFVFFFVSVRNYCVVTVFVHFSNLTSFNYFGQKCAKNSRVLCVLGWDSLCDDFTGDSVLSGDSYPSHYLPSPRSRGVLGSLRLPLIVTPVLKSRVKCHRLLVLFRECCALSFALCVFLGFICLCFSDLFSLLLLPALSFFFCFILFCRRLAACSSSSKLFATCIC